MFDSRLCNTDSTRASRTDYHVPRITLCANFLGKDEHIQREMIYSLVKVHDFLRNQRQWESCEQYACSVVRATLMSKTCHKLLNADQCITRVIETELENFPQCQAARVREVADEALQKCHMDRSPFGLT